MTPARGPQTRFFGQISSTASMLQHLQHHMVQKPLCPRVARASHPWANLLFNDILSLTFTTNFSMHIIYIFPEICPRANRGSTCSKHRNVHGWLAQATRRFSHGLGKHNTTRVAPLRLHRNISGVSRRGMMK